MMNLVKDTEFTELINSNYYIFYTNTSLSRRFLKSYRDSVRGMFESSSGSGYDSSGGWSFFGGGGSFRGGGGFSRRPVAKAEVSVHFKKKEGF